jgi:hypothetical protein
MPSLRLATVAWVLAAGLPAIAAAQAAAPENAPNPSNPAAASTSAAATADNATATPGQDEALERFLPQLDLLFPEGALDLKVSRLINKVLFEGQVRYTFVNGDITAFLRYRYYGDTSTTQVEVFDQINFGHLGLNTTFDRTRGLLVFEEWPHSYTFRTFAMAEVDRLSSNQQSALETNNFTNTFVRLGAQLGTPGDNRTQAIVGDTRSYVPNIFTAVREIGPNQFSFTSALSYGAPVGAFDYLKLEAEAIKRFDLTSRVFLVGRMHLGSFPYSRIANAAATDPEDHFAIPLDELFNLGGPDNLKGVSSDLIGTQELHNTWELFFPWFVGQDHRVLDTHWQSWYWILYAGVGTLGNDSKTYTDLSAYIPDTGLGFESSVHVWRYRLFVSSIVARALKGSNHLEARLSVRSYR